MNLFPRMNHFKTAAPIPHQFAIKLHESTWIYISEKFWDMRFIDYYGTILTYEKFRYLAMPNFICLLVNHGCFFCGYRALPDRPRWFRGSGGSC